MFSCYFPKTNGFCDFLIASLEDKTLQKCGLKALPSAAAKLTQRKKCSLLSQFFQERICSRNKFLPSRPFPTYEISVSFWQEKPLKRGKSLNITSPLCFRWNFKIGSFFLLLLLSLLCSNFHKGYVIGNYYF